MKALLTTAFLLLVHAPHLLAEELGMMGEGETEASRQIEVELVDPVVLAESLAATNSFMETIYDQGARASWAKFSALGKKHVSKEDWFAAIEETRITNGARLKSEFLQARRADDVGVAGLEKGDYVLILLRTTYENRSLQETVLLSFERRRWRVCSYSFQELLDDDAREVALPVTE